MNWFVCAYRQLLQASVKKLQVSGYKIDICNNNFPYKLLSSELKCRFQYSEREIHSIIENCPNLLTVPFCTVSENLELFIKMGISKASLKSSPWILTYTTGSLAAGIHCIKKLHSDINVAFPFLEIPLSQLKKISYKAETDSLVVPGGNRIDYISSKLKCSPLEVSYTLVKHQYLFGLPVMRIDAIFNLLSDAEVSTQSILKDMWVFQYNTAQVQERLQLARRAGIKSIKPWIVRCPETTFANMVQKQIRSRTLLGEHGSVLSYLCQRLECSEEVVAFLNRKSPNLLKVNVPKLKKILDFLYSEGFTPQQVCQVPRIMNHSIETIQSRLKQLRDLGYNPSSLIVLCKSKRQYKDFVEKLKPQISIQQLKS